MAETSASTTHRQPGLLLACLPLAVMALLLGVGYGMFHLQAQVLLICAAVCAGLVGWRLGYSWDEMQQGIVESVRKALPAILIMLCVGMLIAAWMASGTIPMLLYYGLKLVSPRFFLVTACLACSVTSLATGTSWGTVGTVGVAFIGIAQALQVPLGPAAGAIVAGAYLGDKLSPFSDIPNLAPVATGTNLFDHLRHMLWSAVPAWLAGLAVYFFMGLKFGRAGASAPQIGLITSGLRAHFTFHAVLLLPLLIVFWFALAKKPVIPGMMLSVATACALAAWLQRQTLVSLAGFLSGGYKSGTGLADIDRLISRGGIMSMMETLLIALAAFSFGGIMQRTGMLAVVLERVTRLARRAWSLSLTAMATTLVTALVTGSSYLSMLIPGELLAPAFRKMDLAAKNLSRIVEECGAIMVPLVPWSMAGVYISGILRVPVTSYLPFAFMNYFSVLLLALYGGTGFTMARRTREDETQVGS
ncbi:MAG: Na+/H+ antiporter NhaC [Acidobacteria bacterium]|jgi:NhaC family Na+:H+ antiporter|nr:Na+/H+ antiporter NhaC [Acidobacteriota bacterium]